MVSVKTEIEEAHASADRIAMGLLATIADLDPVESVCALAIAQSFLIPIVGGEGAVSDATMLRIRPGVQAKLLKYVTKLCQEAREQAKN